MVTFKRYPPALTPDDFNKEQDYLEGFCNGFTPSGTFVSPYSFVIAKATDGGVDYYSASNAYQTIYGGSTTADHHNGGVDGASMSAVWQACLDAGGTIYLAKSCTTLDGPINIKTDTASIAEQGTVLTYTGAAASTVFSNTTKRSRNCLVAGFKLDINSIANVYPFKIDSVWRYNFQNLEIVNCIEKPVFTVNSSDGPAAGGVANTAFCNWDNIIITNAYGAFEFEGKESNSEITLCKMSKIWASEISGKGITYKGWASGIHGDTVWIALDTAGATGVIWNDSATPAANVGDYDNNFVNLKVDAFGLADNAATTLLKFNCTKGDWVRNFFYSNTGGFLGTAVDDIAETVSYRVDCTEAGQDERATRKGLFMRVISKGFNFGPLGADAIALDGKSDLSGAYLSVNDSYWDESASIYLRTKDAGDVNRQATITMNSGEGALRIGHPLDAVWVLQAGKKIYFRNAADANKVEIQDDGDISIVDDTAGLILKDRNTGAYYRLKVTGGGTLGVEAV